MNFKYTTSNCIFFFIVLICSACAQSPNTERSVSEVLTAEQYKADLTQLANQLKSLHPKMYEYVSKDSFNTIVENKLASFTNSTTLGEFIWSARELSALVACGHTFVPTLSRKFQIDDTHMFPLYGKFVGESFYVLGNIGNEVIPIGAKILSINGQSISKLKAKIFKVISADGNNISFKNNNINSDFEFYCSYELNFPPFYTVEYRVNDSEIRTKTLNSLTTYDFSKYRPINCPDNLCAEINEETSTATIRIRSFVYYNSDFPIFQKFIDDIFTRISESKTENIILDIRGNGGGDPYCASYLLQHLSDKPFQYYKKGTTDYYQDLQTEIPLKENNFKGDLYTITDGRCFSTSGHLLSLMKHYKIGTIVGRESGATYRCNANTTEIQANHTGISYYISRATYSTIAEEFPANRGIIPDRMVEYTKEDLINGIDLDMEVVKEMIQKK